MVRHGGISGIGRSIHRGVFFSAALPRIQADGEIHRFVYREFRKTILQPFPYKLFYRLHHDTWIVVLVVHAALDPATIREQLDERE